MAKIVNILLSDKSGGVEQSFVNYCKLIKGLGHQVLAIVKTNAPYKNSIQSLGIEVVEINNHFGYYDFQATNKIQKLLKDFDADLLFAHVGRAVVLSKRSLKKIAKKISLIAVNHSNNVKRSIGSDIILSVNKEIFYKTVDLGQPFDRSFVMANFIELEAGRVNNFDPSSFLIRKNQVRIGALSRLIPEKGLEYLIKAVKILKDRGFGVKLKIAGDGRSKSDLAALVGLLELTDHVNFAGWIDDKDSFFSDIDIFCLPSIHHETFGMVLIEAMEYGKPLIAADDVGPKSIIKTGINGVLVDRYPLSELPLKIAESVVSLVDNPELVAKLVDNAKQDLLKHYSSQAAAGKMQEVIKIALRNQ